MEYYNLEICGLKRQLPIVYLGPKMRIASLSLLGDVELVEKASRELLQKVENIDYDYFVGPEVKVVPLLHEMSRLSQKKRYIVCRKSIKGYMINPLILHPSSPFKKLRSLIIDGADKKVIENKKVIVLDDVVTTGTTISAVEQLMDKAGAKVVAACAILKQGSAQIKDLIYLGNLPIFTD
ncbi:MAG: adenine phosphoribosyltransferase [Patescibacteria group bacterium]|nr:adenine phosphoribosyltransferase [Patescibacteria group bacterium]